MMIDKMSGQVRFAVMSFGGFLGMGEKYHQLPWNGLTYDLDHKGYVVNLSRDALNDLRRLLKHMRSTTASTTYSPIPAPDQAAVFGSVSAPQ